MSDPTQNAAVIAQLTARSDGASFTLTTLVSPSPGVVPPGASTVAPALALAFAPRTPSTVLLTWSAVYRNTRLSGTLACDAGLASVATAALLACASSAFDLTDQHLATLGTTLPVGSTLP